MTKTIITKEQATVEKLLPEINANHRECMSCGRDAVEHAAQAGALLAQIKSCVKHGQFEALIEKRCDFAVRTAQAYMKLADGMPLLKKQGKELGSDATIGGCLRLITEAKKPDKPKAHDVRISPTAGSDSEPDTEPTPTEVELPQVESISTDKAEQPAVKRYADTFEPSTFKADELDLASKQEPYDRMLNARTVIVKAWNEITADERDGVYAVDKKNRVDQILRDLLTPIAQARPHAVCSECKGKGCKKCQNCGWWPRSVVEGLKR